MESDILKHALLLFFVALITSLFLTPHTEKLAEWIGAVDSPDANRKVHSRAVTRLGGIAMAIALLGALLLGADFSRGLTAFIAGAVVVVLVGFLDDLSPMRSTVKFAGQVAGASVFVLSSGFRLDSLGDLFASGPIATGALAPVLTVFCMVGVMNALNLSDGLDGLAGGISTIACIFFGIFAYLQGDHLSLWITVALLGSLFGFLRYNTFPAKLFMGDSGSLLLGYTLAAVAVILVQKDGVIPLAPVTVAGVLALPVIDTLFVMIRRLLHRQNPFHPDKTHLHHRLLGLGLPHAAVVPILYGATASFGSMAWGLRAFPEWVQFAAIVLLGAAVNLATFSLRRVRGLFPAAVSKENPGMSRDDRIVVRITVWMGRSVPLISWFIALGLCLPALLSPDVPARAGVVAFGMAAFMLALYPWRSQRVNSGICYGLMYASCVCMMGILHFLPASATWLGRYLNVFSGIVLVWVLLKMKVQRRHKKVMLISGFEALLIGVSLFVPTVLVPAAGFGEPVRNALLMACLESIPLLLALKILVRKQPRRNYVMAGSLLVGLIFLGVKGMS
jgi:UDP-GlcNAc:undecaprenyl-phosphate GlcNAc-1-phosphate transferase